MSVRYLPPSYPPPSLQSQSARTWAPIAPPAHTSSDPSNVTPQTLYSDATFAQLRRDSSAAIRVFARRPSEAQPEPPRLREGNYFAQVRRDSSAATNTFARRPSDVHPELTGLAESALIAQPRRGSSKSEHPSVRRPSDAKSNLSRYVSPERTLGAVLLEPSIWPQELSPGADIEGHPSYANDRARHLHTLQFAGELGADDSLRQRIQRVAAAIGGVIAAGISVGLIVYFVRHHKAAESMPRIDNSSVMLRFAPGAKLIKSARVCR